MDRIITLLCALVLAAGGALAWDRHPPIRIPVLFFHYDLPKSLAQERDEAREAQRLAEANVSVLKAALDAQKTAVTAIRTESATRIAQSQKATQEASREVASYQRQVARVMSAKPASSDLCDSADKLIRETIR